MFSIKLTRLFPVTFALFAISGIAGSCSKKDAPPVAKTTLITTSTWKYSDSGVDQNADGVFESSFPLGTLDSCQIDFILTFKSDKSGIMDEGAKKCSPSDPQTTPFTWDITNNDTELTLSASVLAGLGGGKTKIIELTKDKMVLATTVAVPGLPITIPATVILVH